MEDEKLENWFHDIYGACLVNIAKQLEAADSSPQAGFVYYLRQARTLTAQWRDIIAANSF
jgi:hypothetical protein